MITPPCKNCKDRMLGCHDKCKSYNTYRLQSEIVKQKRNEEKKLLDYHISKVISCAM